MAVRYVRDILHDELTQALDTGLVPATFIVVKKGDLLGNSEGWDSAKSPGVIVEAPALQSVEPVTTNLSKFSYQVTIRIHDSNVTPATAEDSVSEFECAIRTTIQAMSSTALTRIGWCHGTAKFDTVGWIKSGQDTMYMMSVTFDSLHAASSAFVDVA